MKKQIALLVLIIVAFCANAQKLVEEQVDEFTGHEVKRTSWERLTLNKTGDNHFRFSSINKTIYFDVKLMFGKVFAIDEDAELMFKLDNGEILKLYNLKYVITEIGAGATGLNGSATPGIQTSYVQKDSDISILKEHDIVKFRIYTTDGYRESDIKPKTAQKIKNALLLVI